jgi:hypothetical protein
MRRCLIQKYIPICMSYKSNNFIRRIYAWLVSIDNQTGILLVKVFEEYVRIKHFK